METSTERPLRRDAERNRQRILVAAREVFAERGLGATLDDVAERAGVGVGTVYRRFPNKELLIDALFEQRITEIAEEVEASIAGADPWTALEQFFDQFVETQSRDRGLMELLVSHEHGRARVTRARDRLKPVVERLIARAHDAGVLRPEIVARDVPVIHVMLASMIEYTRDVRPEARRRYLALILDALRADGQPRTELPGPALTTDEIDAAMAAWKPRPG